MSDEIGTNSSSNNEESKSNVIQQEAVSKNKVISSLIWKFLERGGVQGVQFVLSIILARLVTPEDYGVIALLLVFIQIATVFIQSGFYILSKFFCSSCSLCNSIFWISTGCMVL